MLDVFKIKPFDLEPIYAQWRNGPVFTGNPKKDPPVEEWLDKIKEGCTQRGVPEEYWYKVAQHFMGPRAKARLDELKQVISKVHDGKYRWTWKKFRIAMINMGWDIDNSATQTIKVHGRSSGLWFMRKKDDNESVVSEEPERLKREPLPRSGSALWIRRKCTISEPQSTEPSSTPPPVPPKRAATDFGSIHKEKDTIELSTEAVAQRPIHRKANSESALVLSSKSDSQIQLQTSDGNATSSEVMTKTTQVPTWLLNACNALDFITSEHPKAMSVLSAILITVGTIPAIPAISAGAGGAVLASGTAHAIGAIAIGIGQALSTSVKNQQAQQQQAQAAQSSAAQSSISQ